MRNRKSTAPSPSPSSNSGVVRRQAAAASARRFAPRLSAALQLYADLLRDDSVEHELFEHRELEHQFRHALRLA